MSAAIGSDRPRRRARRGQGEQLRAEVLAAAAALLVETGREDEVSIRAVAQRVGVTPPSIYLHFEDKDALLEAVCVEAFADLDTTLAAAGESGPDVLTALAAQGRAYVEFALARPEHYRLMFMRRSWSDLDAPSEAELSAVAGLGRVIEAIVRAQTAGAIPAHDDPTRLAMTMWMAAHGLAALLIAKPHFPWGDVGELIDRTLAMCLHGIAAGGSPGAKRRARRRTSPA